MDGECSRELSLLLIFVSSDDEWENTLSDYGRRLYTGRSATVVDVEVVVVAST